MDDAKCLVINVRPGWKKGTKVSFVNEGDEAPNTIPADLEFVIQEKENSDPGYVREGNNLIYTYRLSLSDALTDHNALQIPTLDQRVISLACPEVVSPFYEKVILGKKNQNSCCNLGTAQQYLYLHLLFGYMLLNCSVLILYYILCR